ncbi:MAG: flagellar basal-body rod protein FlgF [Thermodesulfobacteriota bacterium]
MQQSMYSALFGALTQEHRLNVIANNLANVNTTGYKQDRMAFKDVFVRFAHDAIREPILNIRDKPLFPEPHYLAKNRIALAQTDFSQGSLKQTGNALDVAIVGEGFFKVQAADGEQYYTRDGSFQLSAEGLLVNGNGDQVLGQGGPVALPPGSMVVIDGRGAILVDGAQVDILQVVNVDNPNGLEKVGNNHFRPKAPGAANEAPAAEAVVEQGFLEAPNVEVVTEMVNMIEVQRGFEAYSKLIQTTQDIDTKAIATGEVR